MSIYKLTTNAKVLYKRVLFLANCSEDVYFALQDADDEEMWIVWLGLCRNIENGLRRKL
jgi:hypothetical protein